MDQIIAVTTREHASENTKYHALFNYFIRRHTKTDIAAWLNKSISTISNWIDKYSDTGSVVGMRSSMSSLIQPSTS